MRRILSALIIISTGILTWAQPLLVGHRGSYWGVENTAEAFINGAKKGYQLLKEDFHYVKQFYSLLWYKGRGQRLLLLNK